MTVDVSVCSALTFAAHPGRRETHLVGLRVEIIIGKYHHFNPLLPTQPLLDFFPAELFPSVPQCSLDSDMDKLVVAARGRHTSLLRDVCPYTVLSGKLGRTDRNGYTAH